MGGPSEPAPIPWSEADRRATETFRVRFDEATANGQIRTSVLLRYAADLAWVHSERRGFGRAWYRERGLAWLVRGVDLELLDRIQDGDHLTGTTEAIAARKVLARRSTEFRTADDRPAASLLVDWALTDTDGSPTRIPAVFAPAFGMTPASFAPVRVRPVPPAGRIAHVRGSVRPHELDPMGHVNNAVYVDWAEEAIRAAARRGPAPAEAIPRRWRLEYHGAAGPGARVQADAWQDDGGWTCRIFDWRSGEPFVGARLEASAHRP